MSRKQFQLTLINKALILVAVPLIFEIGLLATLYSLFNQAEAETYREQHAKTVIAKSDALVQLFYDMGMGFVIYDAANHATRGLFENRLNRMIARVPIEIADMESLVKDNQKHVAIMKDLAVQSAEAMQVLSARVLDSKAGKKVSMEDAFQMRYRLSGLVDRLNVISADEEELRKKDPQAADRLKTLLKRSILFGVLASILIALFLVAVFHRGTATRLKTLIANGIALGKREQLTPVLAGDDEIAHLDRVIHDAAGALAEAAQKERAVIEYAADVICSIDASGKFTAVSPASIELWGHQPNALLGKSWLDLVEQEDVERCMQWAEKMRAGQSIGPLENRIRRSDDNVIDMLWSMHWSQKEQSMFCVAHDITDRRELERFKQEFVAMVSHDLRTPLTAVQTTLTLLGRGAWGTLTEKGVSKVLAAGRNISRSVDLINNLLDLEKMESGKLEMHFQSAPLRDLIERSAEVVAALAERKSISVALPANECDVNADPGQLAQVLINLLGNAVKFSPEGSTVTVSVEEVDTWVTVRVADQGPGVPLSHREAIFDRYYQVSSTSESGVQGSGLGLAICKAIIEGHGGSIGVESEDAKGSTFWFRIRSAESIIGVDDVEGTDEESATRLVGADEQV